MESPSRRDPELGLAKKGIGGAAFDVGVPVLDLIHKGQLAFTVDQQAYCRGHVNLGAVPLQHHGRTDNTRRCRHRLQVRDQGQCRRLCFTHGQLEGSSTKAKCLPRQSISSVM